MGKSKSNNKKRKSSSSSDQCNQSSPNVCALCEKYSSSSESRIGSNKRNRTFHSVQDFWFHGTSMKQKLSLLQVDKGFVLKQIRSSNLYNPNFSLKKSTTLSSSLSSSSTSPTTTTVSSSVPTANSVNTSNNDNSSTTSSSTVDALASSSMHVNQQRMAASSTQPTISAPVLTTPANVSSHHHQHSNNSTSVVISSSSSQPSTALSQLQQQQPMNSTSHHHGSVLSNNTNSVTNNNATTTNMNNSGSGSVNTNIPNVNNNNTQPNKMMLPKSISGRKPLFGGKETCLCPACKKRKAIFNVVVKVFEDYIEELECKSCGKAMPVRPSPQIQSISLGSISTSLSSRMPGVNQLPFGDCLIIKNDKLTVSEAYLKDGGAHFYDIMKKCSEIFPDDLKLQPHQSPPPENIHMLINYCTMNSELNIKNIMLKAKKNALMNEIHSSDESSDEELSGSEDGDDDEDDEDEGDDEDDDEYTSDSDADSDESTSDGYISGEECDEVLPKDDSININGIVRSNTQESRLLFQIYLARIFAHNVNVAFRDIVALQAQRELLEECEIDEKMKSNKQSKNTKKQSKQKKSKQKKVPASAAAKTTSKITPTKQERETIPPLDILKEATSVIMSEEMVEDEWNVVQAKAKVPKQSKYSPQDEGSPRDEFVLQSLEPPSRSVSPTLSTASTISAVSTNSSTSGTNTSQKKKKKNRASNEVTKQINFDTKSPIKEEPSFTEQFKTFTDVRLNDSSFFEDIDSMLNDSYMTPRSNDYGNYSIPPIGYELRSSNDAHNDQHLVQNSFSPFTLPTFFPLVNRL